MTPAKNPTLRAVIFTMITILVQEKTVQISAKDSRYCNVPCSNEPPGSHTLCKYDCNISSDCPPSARILPNTPTIQDLFEEIHNEVRNAVALGEIPKYAKGANMMRLVYDMELESMAECWAAQCSVHSNHELCRKNLNKETVGQNIGTSGNLGAMQADTKKSLRFTTIHQWKQGKKHMPLREIEKYTGSALGGHEISHWAQLIWAKTTRVGCGRLFTNHSGLEKLHIICNYAASVNISEPVYLKGTPCSACPNGSHCDSKYKGLCINRMTLTRHSPTKQSQSHYRTTSVGVDYQNQNNSKTALATDGQFSGEQDQNKNRTTSLAVDFQSHNIYKPALARQFPIEQDPKLGQTTDPDDDYQSERIPLPIGKIELLPDRQELDRNRTRDLTTSLTTYNKDYPVGYSICETIILNITMYKKRIKNQQDNNYLNYSITYVAQGQRTYMVHGTWFIISLVAVLLLI